MSETDKFGAAYEFTLVKSPMVGKPEEKKPEEKKTEQKSTTAPQPGFEHIANIPTIFCATREVAKGLLIDLFAMIGTLNAIETGTVDVETLPDVLKNAQRILTHLSDAMIRDCGVTDADLDEVMNVFTQISAEIAQTKTAQPVSVQPASVQPVSVHPVETKQEQKVVVEPANQRKPSIGSNVL